MVDEDLREIIARMDERWERVEKDLEKLKHVLIEGNGQPAMTVRLALVEKDLDRVKEDRDDRKMPRHVNVGIIVSIVLAGVGVIAGFSS